MEYLTSTNQASGNQLKYAGIKIRLFYSIFLFEEKPGYKKPDKISNRARKMDMVCLKNGYYLDPFLLRTIKIVLKIIIKSRKREIFFM